MIKIPFQTSVTTEEVAYGLGDVVEDILHSIGVDKLAHLYEDITEQDCGCTKRKEILNKLFPLEMKKLGD